MMLMTGSTQTGEKQTFLVGKSRPHFEGKLLIWGF